MTECRWKQTKQGLQVKTEDYQNLTVPKDQVLMRLDYLHQNP